MKKKFKYFAKRGINCIVCGYPKFKTKSGLHICAKCNTVRVYP